MTGALAAVYQPSGTVDSVGLLLRTSSIRHVHSHVEIGSASISLGGVGSHGDARQGISYYHDVTNDYYAVVEGSPVRAIQGGDVLDASQLLELYHEHGDDFGEYVQGSFTVFVWDGKSRDLYCLRDKLGKRHLYFSMVGNTLILGSEIGMILSHPSVERKINHAMVVDYLSGSLDRNLETFYEGVFRLDAGTMLHASPNSFDIKRYWSPVNAAEKVECRRTGVKRVRDGLEQTIQTTFDRDGSRGILLSGGLDSGTVAMCASSAVEHSIPAIFGETDSREIDERTGMNAIIQSSSVDVESISWRSSLYNDEVTDTIFPDHPCIDASHGLYADAVSAFSSQGVSHVVTGHGGNLFDGNQFCTYDLAANREFDVLLNRLQSARSTIAHLILYVLMPLFLPPEQVSDFTAKSVFDRTSSILEEPKTMVQRSPFQPPEPSFESFENRVLWNQLTDPYMDFAFDGVTKIARRYGLTFEHPLLDEYLVSTLFSLPPGAIQLDGESKGLFKQAVKEILPEAVINQPTSANTYESVVDRDLRAFDGSQIRRLISSPRLERLQYVDTAELRALCQAYANGERSLYRPIWRFLMVDRWLYSQPISLEELL